MPVLAAGSAGTGRYCFVDSGVANVSAISDGTGIRVDVLKPVLIDRFLEIEKLASCAIELPQDAVLTDAEHHGTPTDIHQHSLVHLIEIEGFTGNILEVPR